MFRIHSNYRARRHWHAFKMTTNSELVFVVAISSSVREESFIKNIHFQFDYKMAARPKFWVAVKYLLSYSSTCMTSRIFIG